MYPKTYSNTLQILQELVGFLGSKLETIYASGKRLLIMHVGLFLLMYAENFWTQVKVWIYITIQFLSYISE